jgi:RNA polymerase sigma-70 factor (ECF subfamily)
MLDVFHVGESANLRDMDDEDDATIETAEQSAKRIALAARLKAHYPGLRLLILKTVRDPHLASDILNDAVATALDHLRRGRIAQPEQLAGYVYQVAMNLLRNQRRKMDERADRRADPSVLESLAGGLASEDALQLAAITAQVRSVIRELPTERDRIVVKRFYLDEDDKESICKDIGLSAAHFDRVVFRARQRLKALLDIKGLTFGDFFVLLLGMA